jgi:hypothetical protein
MKYQEQKFFDFLGDRFMEKNTIRRSQGMAEVSAERDDKTQGLVLLLAMNKRQEEQHLQTAAALGRIEQSVGQLAKGLTSAMEVCLSVPVPLF